MVIIFMRETGSICSTCLSKLCLRERVLSHILYMILHASPRSAVGGRSLSDK
jgi:HrpA-like RNA helicase